MNYERQAHSSCVLDTSLYVYGGFKDRYYTQLIVLIERLMIGRNCRMYEASNSWEILQINADRYYYPFMVHLNCSQKILILGAEDNDYQGGRI